jgi:hypothetical protein
MQSTVPQTAVYNTVYNPHIFNMFLRMKRINYLNRNNRLISVIVKVYVFCEVGTEFICTFERPYVSNCPSALDINKILYLYVVAIRTACYINPVCKKCVVPVTMLCQMWRLCSEANVVGRRHGLF